MADYEWSCEELNADGDIINILFCESYNEAIKSKYESSHKCEIALLKNIGNNEGGLIDRYYFYVINESLSASSEYVPKRYFNEVLALENKK